MATMFEGEEKAVIARLERMPVKEFLEKLLEDDLVNEIISRGNDLVIEWTTAVRPPWQMLCFGIKRDGDDGKNIYFVFGNDGQVSCGSYTFGFNCNREKTGISVDKLLKWLAHLNISDDCYSWVIHILEAREGLERGHGYLPLRYDEYMKRSHIEEEARR